MYRDSSIEAVPTARAKDESSDRYQIVASGCQNASQRELLHATREHVVCKANDKSPSGLERSRSTPTLQLLLHYLDPASRI